VMGETSDSSGRSADEQDHGCCRLISGYLPLARQSACRRPGARCAQGQ
jgi:hypothetical protein